MWSVCWFAILAAVPSAGTPASRPSGPEPWNPVAAGRLPQYVFVHKAPGGAGRWNQAFPASFTGESIREIIAEVGVSGKSRRRLGVMFTFSVLEGDLPTVLASLDQMLAAARTQDMPVLVCLDAQNWWQSRPDLWNWWDETLPGFNPANRENVEWTGWGPEHAIKISWRNWGRQLRVRPAPNLFAPRVVAETRARMLPCLRRIEKWRDSLPKDKEYLFAGLKLGWEASLNVNAYHHLDGNRLFESSPNDASGDPGKLDHDAGFTFGLAGLGYAAATSSKLKRQGDLTVADHELLVHRYLAGLCRMARGVGLPAHLIFTHQGGTYAPWDKHLAFWPAINPDSIPGWSFYSHDPADITPLGQALAAAGRRQWAAVEWMRPADTAEGWAERLNAALDFGECRLLAIYNWESIRGNPAAIAGLRKALESAPASRPTQ